MLKKHTKKKPLETRTAQLENGMMVDYEIFADDKLDEEKDTDEVLLRKFERRLTEK